MSKLLRTDLPDDVWDRLNDEAASHGVKIGVYVKRLIITRDAKKQARAQVSDTSDTRPSNRKA